MQTGYLPALELVLAPSSCDARTVARCTEAVQPKKHVQSWCAGRTLLDVRSRLEIAAGSSWLGAVETSVGHERSLCPHGFTIAVRRRLSCRRSTCRCVDGDARNAETFLS